METSSWRRLALLAALAMTLPLAGIPASAHPDQDGEQADDEDLTGFERDPSAALEEHDDATDDVSAGPSARVTKNLRPVGHGARLVDNATTDVWAHGGFAYIGTFNSPCGTGVGFGGDQLVDGLDDPGVPVFNVRNRKRPTYLGNVPSVEASRINDVKVASMNSGDILVHSNEACATGGPGGFEIYQVDDPSEPVHHASVRIDDPNEALHTHPNAVIAAFSIDVGVHNLFLFSQGERDFVTAVTEGWFGNFHLYEITDPQNPELLSVWGAEELCDLDVCEGVDPLTEDDPDVLFDIILDWMLAGFGDSQNRFLHDITVSADGSRAYLSNWDAGLVLLDVTDPADLQVVSVALEPEAGSLDDEVNSHAAWPSEDGSVVVETEEDFNVFASFDPFAGTFGDVATNTIPGVGVSTRAGDDFEANPGNTVTVSIVSGNVANVAVDAGPLAGNEYVALEFSGSQPRLADTGPVSGEAVWVGTACGSIAEDLTGAVAIARRGDCLFAAKMENAVAAGAEAIVIANNVGDSVWGGVRIWDYADETDPQLVSTINTVCSADPNDDSCDPRGTYSVHNVIVEDDKAYFSWYSDGVLIFDISDPADPVEVARWHEAGPAFEASNGGIQDVWGIYKVPDEPWLYASDRNGGLYILKERGSGSGKRP